MGRIRSKRKRKRIAIENGSKQKTEKSKKKASEPTAKPKPKKGLLKPGQKPLESKSIIRLSKVAKELNKSLPEIVEFLQANGFKIEPRPNTKLGPEHIEFINGENQSIQDSFVIDYTLQLIEALKVDYEIIFTLSPSQFEALVARFLENSGFKVQLTGRTNQKDGGVDIIAWKADIISIVIAVQVKFKTKHENKVVAGEVSNLLGVLNYSLPFHAGMLVTNTSFTQDARFYEEKAKIELKDSENIQKWLHDNFIPEQPMEIDLQLGKDVHFKNGEKNTTSRKGADA